MSENAIQPALLEKADDALGQASHPTAPAVSAPQVLWSTRDISEGSGADAWLIADLDGDHRDELIQAWNNDGKLGLIVYGWNGTAMAPRWAASDMGQGADAVAWLIGDFNGDGKDEILQLWDHDGSLGIIVYGWTGKSVDTLFVMGDTGQGAGAVRFLIDDIDGDGKDEILQLWDHDGSLGIIVYGWRSGGIATLFVTGDTGQGAGAVEWLIGDLDGDGKAEIVQQYDHNGTLASIVYGWNGRAIATRFSGDLGQGPDAVAWLIGDVNGDGKAEIVQEWNNDGSLGTIVYAFRGNAMVQLWGSSDLGQGSGALAYLLANLDGGRQVEVVQEWDSNHQVATLVYGWNGGAMTTRWNVNMSEGAGAFAWRVGRILGNGRSQILQLWNNGGALAMILYGIPQS